MKGLKIVRRIVIFSLLMCLIIGLVIFVLGKVRYSMWQKEVKEGDEVALLVYDKFILHNPYTKLQLLEMKDAKTIISSLNDEDSVFLTKEEVEALEERSEMHYMGVGFEGDKTEGSVLEINNVHPGTPSLYAGLARGDKVVKIDGDETQNMSLVETIKKIRGKEGTSVCLSIKRGARNFDCTLTRREISGKLCDSKMLDKDVGYLSIRGFPEGIHKEIISNIAFLIRQDMKKLIIDVRGNEGGDVKEVAPLLSMILPFTKKVLFSIQSNYCERENYRRSNEVVFLGPITLLCDNYTRGCAELFLSCIKDMKRGKIVGDITRGKQTTQTNYTLKSGNMVKISTGIMYSPNDTYYERIGIMPDVLVQMDPILSRQGFINEDSDSYNKRMMSVRKVLEDSIDLSSVNLLIEQGDIQLKKAYEIIKDTPCGIYGGKW